MTKSYCLGFQSICESNLFLRCLWSRIRKNFGQLAWQTFGHRIPNTTSINVGMANVYDTVTYSVSMNYSKKGNLKCITFDQVPESDVSKLDLCIREAKQYDFYIKKTVLKTQLEKSLCFEEACGKNFKIDGNSFFITVKGFDKYDIVTVANIYMPIICDIMSFYTMRYVSVNDCVIELLRIHCNKTFKLVVEDSDKVLSEYSHNDALCQLKLDSNAISAIDDCLDRELKYDNHRNRFESSLGLYAQGLFFDELSLYSGSQGFPYLENAIVSYMSALEIITAKDKEPVRCNCCGQLRYSIAKRVVDLVSSINPDASYFLQKLAKDYYSKRSKYVHEGKYLSARSYAGVSLPLLSMTSDSGMIVQNAFHQYDLKEIVKDCIIWHEGNQKAGNEN